MGVSYNHRVGTVSIRRPGTFDMGQTALFLLTLMLWSDRILLNYASAVIMRFPLIGLHANDLILILYVVLILASLPEIFAKIRYVDFAIGLVIGGFCLLNYFLYPENTKVLDKNLPEFILYSFPLYYVGVSMDWEKTYPWLYKLSVLTIIMFTLHKVFINEPMTHVQSVYEGDMWSSYNLLPHVGVVVIRMLKKPRFWNTAASVTGILMLTSLGTRGSLLCVVLLIAVYLLAYKEYRRPRTARFLIIACAAILVLFMDDIMMFLRDFAENVGLSTRIFEKYFEGSFSKSASRDAIQEKLLRLVRQEPFLGYGLFADRTYIGTYAHSLYVELWLNFGVIIGSALLVAIIRIFWKTVKCIKRKDAEILLLLPLFVTGFVKLFMSGSYLSEMYLFWLLGLCVMTIRKAKKRERGVPREEQPMGE